MMQAHKVTVAKGSFGNVHKCAIYVLYNKL